MQEKLNIVNNQIGQVLIPVNRDQMDTIEEHLSVAFSLKFVADASVNNCNNAYNVL